jgi:Pyruvate/2-oxoacid:ferredoxin oxidoreductase delta subunit
MSDVYDRLRRKFDSMASGFPETASGSEIKLLKLLYNESEAALFLEMMETPETPRQIAGRIGKDEKMLASEVETMAKKGLLYRKREENKVFYSAVPFVIGILEFQVKRLEKDPELAAATGMYGLEGLLKSLTEVHIPQQRTIPINTSIVNKWPVATYDDALSIIERQDLIGVVSCTCRVIMNTLGVKGCENPIENCIGFGDMAEYYIENQFGRKISKDEAVAIIGRSDEQGMVLQPFNGKNAGAICSCCGDCCAMLRSLAMNPSPAGAVKSTYYAAVEESECTGCEICVSRCQIDAVSLNEDEIAVVDLNRCIGCGLCVTTCPSESIHLIRKNDEDLYELPEDLNDAHKIMALKRNLAAI